MRGIFVFPFHEAVAPEGAGITGREAGHHDSKRRIARASIHSITYRRADASVMGRAAWKMPHPPRSILFSLVSRPPRQLSLACGGEQHPVPSRSWGLDAASRTDVRDGIDRDAIGPPWLLRQDRLETKLPIGQRSIAVGSEIYYR